MKTFQLQDGNTLVISVDGGAWETITFEAKDFSDIEAATAEELINVLNRSGSLAAYVDEQENLVLATATQGGHTSLEVDIANSTAAAPLGLSAKRARAKGEGLRAARLYSQATEPFDLPRKSEMTVIIDDHRRKVSFDEGITEGKATAAEVAKVINAKKKKVADVTRDGRVMITSLTVGIGSKLEIEPAPEDKIDASSILGFIGASAFDEPHKVEPAKLVCEKPQAGLEVLNLTASPIELHFSSGTTVIPARGSVSMSPGDAANSQLQRLIEQGVVRLAASGDV